MTITGLFLPEIDVRSLKGSAISIHLMGIIGGKSGIITVICGSESQRELVERVVDRARARGLTSIMLISEVKESSNKELVENKVKCQRVNKGE